MWRLACFRDTGIVLCSQLFGDLWKEQICLNSLLCIPKHRSSPTHLGRTSTWYSTFLEYMYMWMVIQFIHIYALKCDLHYLVYLFISINALLPYDASYLMCNTNLIYYVFFNLLFYLPEPTTSSLRTGIMLLLFCDPHSILTELAFKQILSFK